MVDNLSCILTVDSARATRREAMLVQSHGSTHIAFLSGILSSDKSSLNMGPPHPDDLKMILSELEVNRFIQWYLKTMYHKELALPGTTEHAEMMEESDARRTKWQEQLHTAKEDTQ